MPGGFGDTGYGTGGYGVTQDGGNAHAPWALEMPYSIQLNIGWVGPHDFDVEWDGYNPRPTREEADVTTSSISSFFSELDSASSGDVIWLDEGDYQIDSHSNRQDIPSNVTAASDGARIYSDSEHDGIFELTNDGARLTGFRFEGSQETGSHDTQSIGILLKADVEMDNCMSYRWMSMGVYTSEDSSGPVEPHIHHCAFFDNRTDGMGYGVAAYTNSDPLIEYCFFNNNRHGIASNGADSTSYRAYNNIHGTDGMIFQFECHAPGGNRMDVQHNEFRMEERNDGQTARAYAQRGVPQDVATIDNNWIYNPLDPAVEGPGGSAGISQTDPIPSDWQNVTFSNNHYGTNTPTDSTIGIQPLDNVATEPEYSITIEVTGGSTSSAIEGAAVEVGNETLTTGAAGTVTTMLTAGTHYLSISADGYETTTDSISVDSDATFSFALTEAASGHAVTFTITNAETAGPVEGATITIEEVADGDTSDGDTSDGDTGSGDDGDGDTGGDAPTSPTAELSVFAEDEWTGQRLDDAEVTVNRVDEPLAGDPTGPWTGVTGTSSVAAGGYDFGELPQGFYQIEVDHEDYHQGTYDEDLWRDAEEESYQAMYLNESGRLPIIFLESTSGPDYEAVVDASDGPTAIQSALDSTSDGGAVRVTGSGSFSWDQSIEVPDNTILDVEDSVSVTVPSSHSVSTYSPGSRDVYSLITNANRSSAENVHIRGGTYDMSNMSEQAGYAGIWLHEASDSSIENVEMNGSGYQIQDNRTYRGFGLALTACTDSEIIDSEAYDSAYDDIGIRGGNVRCRVVRSGGSGATSGTIQTARWGYWNLSTAPRETEYVECWGRRVYCHDGSDTVWDGCQSNYRLQTIGTSNPIIRNSSDFQGTILIYTLDSGTSEALIETMEFASDGASDAIQIGPNGGQDIGHVTIDDCYADRPTWIHFNDYSTTATVGTVEVTNSELYGSELISKDSGVDVGTLIFRNCEIHNFDTGIVGSYDNVTVENCDIYGMSSSDLIDVSANVSTSGNTYH